MATAQRNGSFTGQPEAHTFAGFLFDLDGTIIDTTDAITKHWQKSVDVLLPPIPNPPPPLPSLICKKPFIHWFIQLGLVCSLSNDR